MPAYYSTSIYSFNGYAGDAYRGNARESVAKPHAGEGGYDWRPKVVLHPVNGHAGDVRRESVRGYGPKFDGYGSVYVFR